MHALPTANQLYGVFENLFEQLQHKPDLVHDFVHSNLVVRINLSNPSAQILLDGRQPPLGLFYGASPGEANFEISLKTELLHQIWMEEVSLVSALFGGDVQSQGNIVRAQPFIQLLQGCAPIYQALATSLMTNDDSRFDTP